MALRTAGSVLVVFLWSVTVVLGQDGWSVTYTTQSICALKGSTVEMSCSYTYPRGYTVTTTFWFTEWETGVEPKDLGQDPEYAGRLEYHGDKKKDCTLRITDLRERDSATYKFSFITDQTEGRYYGDPGVTLSVTALQVKVTPSHWSQWKILTCSTTTCILTGNPYTWYKNGQVVTEKTSTYSVPPNDKDSYSCAVKGHEDLHSPAVCVDGQRCSRVTYTKRTICVLKGSTVDISCTYVGYYSTTSSFWFRSNKSTPEDLTRDPGYAGRVEYTGTYRGPNTLRITDLREEDSAEYRFTFKTYYFEWGHSFPGTSLSVTGLQVKVTPAAEGQKTLTCSTTCTLTDNPNPTYIWYKNGQVVTEKTSLYLVLPNAVDSYYCAVKGHEDLSSPAVYKPKTTVSVSPSGEIVEGSSVTLTCSSDANPPVQSYNWWYKKNGAEYQSKTGPQHVFNQIQSPDTGEYYCEAQNEMGTDRSRTINMDMKYDPKNTSVSVSPSGEIVEGSSVTLTCSSDANPPVDKYTWYKKNVTSAKASGQSYSITNISSEDKGEYYCEAQNGRGSMNSTALMIIVAGKQTSVLTAAVGIIVVVLVLILCLSGLMWFRRCTGGSDATADTQSVHPDCNSDTYTSLNMRTTSPDYDTLASVHPDPTSDPNSDMYTPLNMKTRSPEYDTLANVRGISH
ncbi:B-cell receptor CD22-like [Salvelinus fontinalis]|uniref:B-cell receptor CD22-like n=1 Tax=Salvelinus fontinalis TaxID=8038 RepID=UPI0024868A5E|nr:B-cell receptor CD22-like [Salvelinus fontinalis]